MLVKQTSLEAYSRIKKELGSRQQEVYDGFLGNGTCTNLELSRSLGIPINQITPRTNELVKLGFVTEDEKRRCSVSGRKAIAWRVKRSD